MDLADSARARVNSLLRRAGLSHMPRAVLAFAAAACLALCGLAVVRFWPGAQAPADGYALQQASSEAGGGAFEAGIAEGTQELKVDVEGCVKAPGLYTLGADARVGEAVDAAGGFTKKAARTSVNLAQKLEDGQQVYIPSKREAEKSAQAKGAAAADDSGADGADAGGAAPEPASGGGADTGKVNLNTADAAQLQTLSGIGPALSQRIVEYRETNGSFAKVEDLMSVPGIGETRFAQIKDGVCV